MSNMKKIIYYLLITILVNSYSYSQERDSLIQLYPGLGDTVDLFDREFFNLYPNVEGFQEASLYIRDNGKLVSKLKLGISNKIVDSTVVNSLSTLNKVRLNIAKLDAENNKKSDIELDAMISLKDERYVKGQLAMFSKRSLYLISENRVVNNISQSSSFKIPTKNVNEINILGQNKTWSHAGWGALAGIAIGGILGFASGDDESGFVRFQAEEKALGLGLTFGLIGGIIGLISGISSSTDNHIIQCNSILDLLKLRDYTKYYYRYDKSVEGKYVELD